MQPKPRRTPWRWLRWPILLAILLLLPRAFVILSAFSHIFPAEDAPTTRVAIIFGAEVTPHGTPSAVLRDRVEAGVDLYQAGTVTQLLMSGWDPQPATMRDYAIQLGVPAEDILLDNQGLRTYATCYQAVTTFGLQEAILVTQKYHLPRAVYTCRILGLDASGVPAFHGRYWRGSTLAWNIRETLAVILALNDLYLYPPVQEE